MRLTIFPQPHTLCHRFFSQKEVNGPQALFAEADFKNQDPEKRCAGWERN